MAVLPKSKFYNSCSSTSSLHINDLFDSQVFKDPQDYATILQCGITFLAADASSIARTAWTANNPRAVQPHQLPTLSTYVGSASHEILSTSNTNLRGSGISIDPSTVTVGGITRMTNTIKNTHTFVAGTGIDIVVSGTYSDVHTISLDGNVLPGQVVIGANTDYLNNLLGPGLEIDSDTLGVHIRSSYGEGCEIFNTVDGLYVDVLYDNTTIGIDGSNKLTLLNPTTYVKTSGTQSLTGAYTFSNPINIADAVNNGQACSYGQLGVLHKDMTDEFILDRARLTNLEAVNTANDIAFSTSSLTVDGYAAIGTTAIKQATVVLGGTTGAAEGAVVNILHGLVSTHILWIQAKVVSATGLGICPLDPTPGYHYKISHDATNIIITNHATESENILSKKILITVCYTDQSVE